MAIIMGLGLLFCIPLGFRKGVGSQGLGLRGFRMFQGLGFRAQSLDLELGIPGWAVRQDTLNPNPKP